MPWKLASLGAIFAMSVLAGCSTNTGSAPASSSEPVTRNDGGRCEAKGAEFAIGKQASAELLEQARSRSGAQTARVVGPDDMITLEYRSDRLNLNADRTGKIERVNCG
ncbi:I78 family peptidase inhibitor [Pseudomonas sp. COR18]|uniref:I78 family peptidase inhibitor n=1 Tax=Pseudomonas sp. COR18 TaxID=3399680 RepID=UPI003B0058BA